MLTIPMPGLVHQGVSKDFTSSFLGGVGIKNIIEKLIFFVQTLHKKR